MEEDMGGGESLRASHAWDHVISTPVSPTTLAPPPPPSPHRIRPRALRAQHALHHAAQAQQGHLEHDVSLRRARGERGVKG